MYIYSIISWFVQLLLLLAEIIDFPQKFTHMLFPSFSQVRIPIPASWYRIPALGDLWRARQLSAPVAMIPSLVGLADKSPSYISLNMVRLSIILLLFQLLLTGWCSTTTDGDTVLVFVPGISFNKPEEVKILENNLILLRNTSDSLRMQCMISVYDAVLPSGDVFRGPLEDCEVSLFPEGLFADHVKTVPPGLLKFAGIKWVFILLDDVVLSKETFRWVLLSSLGCISRAAGFSILDIIPSLSLILSLYCL